RRSASVPGPSRWRRLLLSLSELARARGVKESLRLEELRGVYLCGRRRQVASAGPGAGPRRGRAPALLVEGGRGPVAGSADARVDRDRLAYAGGKLDWFARFRSRRLAGGRARIGLLE